MKIICLLNRGTQTCIDPSSGNTSAIDLTMCDPTNSIDYFWQVYEHTCGTDHLQILRNNTKLTEKKNTLVGN